MTFSVLERLQTSFIAFGNSVINEENSGTGEWLTVLLCKNNLKCNWRARNTVSKSHPQSTEPRSCWYRDIYIQGVKDLLWGSGNGHVDISHFINSEMYVCLLQALLKKHFLYLIQHRPRDLKNFFYYPLIAVLTYVGFSGLSTILPAFLPLICIQGKEILSRNGKGI